MASDKKDSVGNLFASQPVWLAYLINQLMMIQLCIIVFYDLIESSLFRPSLLFCH
uniref:Uncharacterized protein n=1 Tax=Arion vulgaris TaxID=1028688 RepID=A0A0B6Z7R5_9EUPU